MTKEQRFQNCIKEQNGPLLRKNAACLVREFLRDELKEPDEVEVRAAMKLRDLFDCRVCAGHVMQVYVKGIMEGREDANGEFFFGMEEPVSATELEEIQKKIFQKELRHPKERTGYEDSLDGGFRCISYEEAMRIHANQRHSILVDVRAEREYEAGHIKGAENLPLISLMKNPYAVSGHRDDIILVYCLEGCQSKIAAQCLAEAGYGRVFYFAWKEVQKE